MREDVYCLPQPSEPRPFRVELCGISYCDGSYQICRNRNSATFVFEFVRKGRGYLRINQEELAPQAGDLYIVPAHSDHVYGSSADDPWEKLWFNVSGPLVGSLLTAYGMDGVHLVRHFPGERFFREGLAIGRRQGIEAHDKIALIIHKIIAQGAACLSTVPGSRQSAVGMELKRYLDANLARPIRLGDLCRHVHKSTAQMLRIFKQAWGVTPYDYLLEQRMQLARQYLENTMKSNKEIASDLGFSDAYYFSNLFRRKNGMSPRHYRRQFRHETGAPDVRKGEN